MRRLISANQVTLTRILLVVPFIFLFLDLGSAPARWKRLTLVVLFAVIALTDMLDGYLARRWGQITLIGRLLDPVADKLLVISSMVLLMTRGVPADLHGAAAPLTLPVWVLAAALAKDCTVILGCLVVYVSTKHLVVNPRMSGKVCTFVQMFMVVVMLLGPDLPVAADLPRIMWRLAGSLAIVAAIDYTLAWRRSRRAEHAAAQHPTTP